MFGAALVERVGKPLLKVPIAKNAISARKHAIGLGLYESQPSLNRHWQ